MLMSIYTCDVCGKSTHINTNSNIIHTGCLLTQFCRGKLRINLNPTNTSIAQANVTRYALDIIHQPLISRQWRGTFTISSTPTIIVYRLIDANTHVQVTSGFTTSITEDGLIVLDFDTPTAGIAHVITHTSYRLSERITPTIHRTPITSNGILTIAVPTTALLSDTLSAQFSTIDRIANTPIELPITFSAHKGSVGISLFDTPWKTVDTVVIHNRPHKLFSANIQNTLPLYDGDFNINELPGIVLLGKSPQLDVVDGDYSNVVSSRNFSGAMNPIELLIETNRISTYSIPIIVNQTIF